MGSPPVQEELIDLFVAHESAKQLQADLEVAEDEMDVLISFHTSMTDQLHNSFAVLEVVGLGVLHEAFVWKYSDDSLLIVGWKSHDEIAIGVLPPGTPFTPTAYSDGKAHTIH